MSMTMSLYLIVKPPDALVEELRSKHEGDCNAVIARSKFIVSDNVYGEPIFFAPEELGDVVLFQDIEPYSVSFDDGSVMVLAAELMCWNHQGAFYTALSNMRRNHFHGHNDFADIVWHKIEPEAIGELSCAGDSTLREDIEAGKINGVNVPDLKDLKTFFPHGAYFIYAEN